MEGNIKVEAKINEIKKYIESMKAKVYSLKRSI